MLVVKVNDSQFFHTSCEVAERLLHNQDTSNARCCNTTNCLCHCEEDITSLKLATEQEAKGYWDDMSRWADERRYEIQHDL